MRGFRLLPAAGLAFVVAAGGCTPPRVSATVGQGSVTAAAHAGARAPANPDLGTVMERYYQQVEGAHWRFAYAMLSPRYRAKLDHDRFVAGYDRFADLDVSLRQYGDRVVVATVGAKDRGSAPRARRFEETTTLAWDGEDWKIDAITRRDLKPSGTR